MKFKRLIAITLKIRDFIQKSGHLATLENLEDLATRGPHFCVAAVDGLSVNPQEAVCVHSPVGYDLGHSAYMIVHFCGQLLKKGK